jgi:hypothetical protein
MFPGTNSRTPGLRAICSSSTQAKARCVRPEGEIFAISLECAKMLMFTGKNTYTPGLRAMCSSSFRAISRCVRSEGEIFAISLECAKFTCSQARTPVHLASGPYVLAPPEQYFAAFGRRAKYLSSLLSAQSLDVPRHELPYSWPQGHMF